MAREILVYFTMAGNWLRDACLWVAIPIVIRTMPYQDTAPGLDFLNQVGAFH